MAKKKRETSKPEAPEGVVSDENGEQLRAMLEGTWRNKFPKDFPATEAALLGLGIEEFAIAIRQSDSDPDRFLAVADRDDEEVVFDLRVVQFTEDGEGTMIFFTFHEEDAFDFEYGGGFLIPASPGVLAGMRMEHMGEALPLYWERTSKETDDELFEAFFSELPMVPLFQGDDEEEASVSDLFAFPRPGTLEEALPGMEGVLRKLKDANIATIEQLLETSDEELLAIRGIGPAMLERIHQRLRIHDLIEPPSFHLDPEQVDLVFKLRVSLEGSKVWRDIELLGGQTLHDLHQMIQVAFNWDDDHLYSFFMSGMFWDESSAISHPFAGDEFDATEVLLACLHLEEGKTFVYLFDFGDEWRHRLEVKEIRARADADDDSDFPRVVDSKGTPPPQYEAWE